jgi:hypothetical protein
LILVLSNWIISKYLLSEYIVVNITSIELLAENKRRYV